ncbi:MAG: hypothetical protein ABIG39_04480 [Candidatus Micrarchaeota archaeon]
MGDLQITSITDGDGVTAISIEGPLPKDKEGRETLWEMIEKCLPEQNAIRPVIFNVGKVTLPETPIGHVNQDTNPGLCEILTRIQVGIRERNKVGHVPDHLEGETLPLVAAFCGRPDIIPRAEHTMFAFSSGPTAARKRVTDGVNRIHRRLFPPEFE